MSYMLLYCPDLDMHVHVQKQNYPRVQCIIVVQH